MKKDGKFYLQLFLSTFYLSAFTFGGGYVIVPLMRKKFVNEYKWIDETQMLDLIAIAQSSPGAIAINSSIIIGYRLSGVLGAVITLVGTVLPPLVIISVISLFYVAFRDNIIVNTVMLGMQSGVAAVICDVILKMSGDIFRSKEKLSIIVMILAFVLSFYINIIFIILFCGLLGAIYQRYFASKIEGDK